MAAVTSEMGKGSRISTMTSPTSSALFREIEGAMGRVSDEAVIGLVADELAQRRLELVSAKGSRNPCCVKAATRELRQAVETLICGCGRNCLVSISQRASLLRR